MVVTLLTEEEQEYIAGKYYDSTSTELAKTFNVSPSLICKVWREKGLKGKTNRRYYANFEYFKQIDTKEKAYFLGFIAADGCIYKRDVKNNTHMKTAEGLLSITVTEEDKEVLEKLKSNLGSNHQINIGKKRGNIQPTATLSIVSETMFENLANYNIVPRKTWTYYPKGIPCEFVSHFIRGYFDGDGSIFSANRNNVTRLCDYTACIVGNHSTLSFIQKELKSKGITISLKEDKRAYKGGKFYELRTKNKKELYSFLNYLYSDNSICLSRKRNKAFEYINKYEKEVANAK